jgi:hypothetical protein
MKKVHEIALHAIRFRATFPPPTRTHIMTIANAIKKVTKAGFTVTQNGQRYSAKKQGLSHLVEFSKNGREDTITCVGVRHQNDHSDSQSDYCATIFTNNITQAIKLAH